MQTPVYTHEKKAFIFWFLNQYEMKLRESSWILTYLANHHKVLRHVHFVRDAKFCQRSFIISAKHTDQIAFKFYRNQLMTTNAEKAFHDIRLNPFEELYIELHFNDANQSPQYASVLEENPFLTDDFYLTEEDKAETENILQYSLQLKKREYLLKEIDQALDQKNEKKFNDLTIELYKIERRLNNQPIQ